MKAFYDSWLQQPLLVGLPSLLFLLYLVYGLARRDWPLWLGRYLVFFTGASLVDAVLTSNRWGLGGDRYGWMVITFFVWLGDLKAYAFVARLRGISWRAALGWSVAVPLASAIFERSGYSGRELFLAYELLFLFAWTVFTRYHRVPSRLVSMTFGYYSLWALADIWLLSMGPAASESATLPWLVRIGANLLYYSLWTPWALATAAQNGGPTARKPAAG